jgi:hypothetical protein
MLVAAGCEHFVDTGYCSVQYRRRVMSDTAVITFRVDRSLKKRFVERARERDRASSQVLRDFMRSFVGQPSEDPSYDQWFRTQVLEALKDPRRPLSSDTVERRFAARRKNARRTPPVRKPAAGSR